MEPKSYEKLTEYLKKKRDEEQFIEEKILDPF